MKAYVTFDDCNFKVSSDGPTADYLKLQQFIASNLNNSITIDKDKVPIKELFTNTFISHAMIQLLDIDWVDNTTTSPCSSIIKYRDYDHDCQIVSIYLHVIDEHNKLVIYCTTSIMNTHAISNVYMGFSGEQDILDSILTDIVYNTPTIEQVVP